LLGALLALLLRATPRHAPHSLGTLLQLYGTRGWGTATPPPGGVWGEGWGKRGIIVGVWVGDEKGRMAGWLAGLLTAGYINGKRSDGDGGGMG
jgi:hypothetical protein